MRIKNKSIFEKVNINIEMTKNKDQLTNLKGQKQSFKNKDKVDHGIYVIILLFYYIYSTYCP